MRIEELSVGDWVYYNIQDVGKRRVQVYSIDADNNHIGTEISDWCNVKDIEPIPLTAEILEKNGFEREDYYYGVMEKEPCYDAYICTIYKNGYVYDIGLVDYCGGAFALQITHIETDVDSEDKTYTQLLKCFEIKYTHQLQHALRLAGVEKEIEI